MTYMGRTMADACDAILGSGNWELTKTINAAWDALDFFDHECDWGRKTVRQAIDSLRRHDAALAAELAWGLAGC